MQRIESDRIAFTSIALDRVLKRENYPVYGTSITIMIFFHIVPCSKTLHITEHDCHLHYGSVGHNIFHAIQYGTSLKCAHVTPRISIFSSHLSPHSFLFTWSNVIWFDLPIRCISREDCWTSFYANKICPTPHRANWTWIKWNQNSCYRTRNRDLKRMKRGGKSDRKKRIWEQNSWQ